MYQDNITIIKERAKKLQKITNIIFLLGIIFLFALIVVVILLLAAQQERFTAIKGNLTWNIEYQLNNGTSFGIYIPFKIIQPLSNTMFSAKSAFIVFLISNIVFKSTIVLYGIRQVSNILKSTHEDATPFIIGNISRLKKIAYSIIIYSSVSDIFISILCWIFVTKIFLLNLSTISISGVLIGGLILFISEIFKYGLLLQKDFDTTL